MIISIPSFGQTSNESADQVWEVGDRRWTIEEERKFEKWVEETITEDFFINYKIPTDCADAVYAIRWIYARIANLPAAATTRNGEWVGHWSTDWNHLPTHPEWHQDRRFRAALFYLFPRTWTGTLPLDTYPVRISTDSVTPGTLFLETESHTGIIRRVSPDGSHAHPLQTWESALPIKMQKLSTKYFFSGRPEFRTGSGLVRFRWPVSENGQWKYLPVKEHPFYSEEQYAPGFTKGYTDFIQAVARRIDPLSYAPMEKALKVMRTINRYLKERVPIVLAGYEKCRNGNCPEGSELWEMHNTLGRDGMIVQMMDYLSEIIESDHLDRDLVKWMMEVTPFDISEERSLTFLDVYQNTQWLSSHPGDSIEARWGLKKCEMIHTKTRATNHSIAFIEKTYRKKDPKYADFSVGQQRHLLARLNEEWNRSECKEPFPTLAKKDLVLPQPVPLRPKELMEPRMDSKRCEKIRTDIQATHDSIAFIEKTYGKKDPEYADFSTRQQQHILTRLNDEWNSGGCR